MQSQRFSRSRRVRRRADFQHAFGAGTRWHGRFVTLVIAPNTVETTRLGLVASRRIGNAVTRNRAKRLMRELFRRHVPAASTPAVDFVMMPRREFLQAEFEALERDFRTILRRSTTSARDAR